MDNHNLNQFENQNYLSLETFRKNGTSVKTPVWFSLDNGKFYITTELNSWKAKRIQNNNHVRIAPCTNQGNIIGVWVDAQAHVIQEIMNGQKANKLLAKKYGLLKSIFDWIGLMFKRERAFLEIEIIQSKND